jgi:hypothetical protein
VRTARALERTLTNSIHSFTDAHLDHIVENEVSENGESFGTDPDKLNSQLYSTDAHLDHIVENEVSKEQYRYYWNGPWPNSFIAVLMLTLIISLRMR